MTWLFEGTAWLGAFSKYVEDFSEYHGRAPLCYVAGPLTAHGSPFGVRCNIEHATGVGIRIAELQGSPMVPHANTGHADYHALHDWEWWMAATAHIQSLCDCTVMLDTWRESTGARKEREYALGRHPLFYAEDL